jgi:hypothetical protein
MPDKLPNPLARAANNFRRRDLRTVEPDPISTAQALGMKPPSLTTAEREGIAAEATLAKNRMATFEAQHERYLQEKRDFETKRDEAIWAGVLARRVAAL